MESDARLAQTPPFGLDPSVRLGPARLHVSAISDEQPVTDPSSSRSATYKTTHAPTEVGDRPSGSHSSLPEKPLNAPNEASRDTPRLTRDAPWVTRDAREVASRAIRSYPRPAGSRFRPTRSHSQRAGSHSPRDRSHPRPARSHSRPDGSHVTITRKPSEMTAESVATTEKLVHNDPRPGRISLPSRSKRLTTHARRLTTWPKSIAVPGQTRSESHATSRGQAETTADLVEALPKTGASRQKP
jgi:hypothetical protein